MKSGPFIPVVIKNPPKFAGEKAHPSSSQPNLFFPTKLIFLFLYIFFGDSSKIYDRSQDWQK
jgi:hypothetical protein